jgi:paraquat-inducible protein A
MSAPDVEAGGAPAPAARGRRASVRARRAARLATVLCGALLVAGLSLPVMELRTALRDRSYSVVTGIVDLASGGNVLLAGVVFLFSVVFPIAKLVALLAVSELRLPRGRRARVLRTLAVLGRWSMLDVFVIVVLVGAVRLGWLSSGRPRAGIYVFGAAILLSMLATVVLERLSGAKPPAAPAPARRSWPDRLRTLAAVALFALGLALPLLDVEKWYWWDNRLNVPQAVLRLAREGAPVLAATVALFVIALPALRLCGMVWWHWGAPPARARRAIVVLDKWAMLDVFGLALLIVLVKIGDLAAVTTRVGLWLLLAAILLSLVDSLRLQRGVRRGMTRT